MVIHRWCVLSIVQYHARVSTRFHSTLGVRINLHSNYSEVGAPGVNKTNIRIGLNCDSSRYSALILFSFVFQSAPFITTIVLDKQCFEIPGLLAQNHKSSSLLLSSNSCLENHQMWICREANVIEFTNRATKCHCYRMIRNIPMNCRCL